MATLAIGPVVGLLKKGAPLVGKGLIAAAPVGVGLWAGGQGQGLRDHILGPYDPSRGMSSTANLPLAILPGAAGGALLLVLGKKLHVAGPSKLAQAAAKAGIKNAKADLPALKPLDKLSNGIGFGLSAAGVGTLAGTVGAGQLVQLPVDFAQAKAKEWVDEHAPYLSFIGTPFSFQPPDIGKAFEQLTVTNTDIDQATTIAIKPGEELDLEKVLTLPEGAEVVEVTERPGFEGGPTLSDLVEVTKPDAVDEGGK
ncbi:MAG: hypothetical protein JWO69_1022 [Thermoleophilia bacterium]|jgi:hypothetical protein|nr:hypothetical protein [Thermoleophilia bacterium]